MIQLQELLFSKVRKMTCQVDQETTVSCAGNCCFPKWGQCYTYVTGKGNIVLETIVFLFKIIFCSCVHLQKTVVFLTEDAKSLTHCCVPLCQKLEYFFERNCCIPCEENCCVSVCAHARISRPTLDAIYSLRFLEWKERGEMSQDYSRKCFTN